jgi:glycosyltransferase involved in cell wall biosynthesis
LLNGTVHLLQPSATSVTNARSPSPSLAKKFFGFDSSEDVILSFGALHPEKDVQVIIEAAKMLPRVTFFHAGKTDASLTRQFTALRQHAPTNFVVHDRYIPEDLKPTYMACASAIVLSYKASTTAKPVMIWEACRFGIPVIASDITQLANFVTENGVGLTFHADNAESLRDAILSLLSKNRDELCQIRQNSKTAYHQISTARWTKEFMELFDTSVLTVERYRS